MPKDTSAAPKPAPSSLLAQILAEKKGRHDRPPIELSWLPPLSSAEEIDRSPRTQPIPDLTSFAKLWMLIGEGNTGKTTLARYLIERLDEHNKLTNTMIAALAPGNRNLVSFAAGTLQPPTADPRDTANWASEYLAALQQARWSGVWDFGGGDTALRTLIEAQPDLAERSEQEGLAIVAAYLFSPRLDDLAFLKALDGLGFRPRATLLILNLGTAEGVPSAFDAIRRQPEYKSALERGAVEIWMPAMPQLLALEIERARAMFAQARDGNVPAGQTAPEISLLDRVDIRKWLQRMDAEFKETEAAGWMPWS
jgi:hypothetical protein